jgi:hypothetical protein
LLWPAFNHIRRGGKPFANHPVIHTPPAALRGLPACSLLMKMKIKDICEMRKK